MIKLSGYTNYQPLHQSHTAMVVAATQVATNLPVVLKYPHPQSATLDQISRIHAEYETLKRLDSPYAVSVYELLEYEGVPVLVLEHVPQISLAARLSGIALSPELVFKIGQELARALDDIHSFGLIYKNLNPENILVDDNFSHPRLIDFGFSAVESIKQMDSANLAIEGAAEHISPEQTGRLNRTVDYRSDIYCLGTTLFELATGRPPFSSDDFLELIFQHLARDPDPPSKINSQIPKTLDNIVLKMLAKEPSDRYQSTYAITTDLKRAEDLFIEDRPDEGEFIVALDDIPEQLAIPNKLVQREPDLQQLEMALKAAKQGSTRPIVVVGDPGVGKTVFLQEIGKLAADQGGLQCLCKAHLVDKDIPFSAVTNLLRELSKLLLSRDDLSQIQSHLYSRLGQKLQYLVQICPELERMLGQSFQPITFSEPLEIQVRLKEAFTEFIAIISEFTKPLVICFDNAHWVDMSSLDLITKTAKNKIAGLLSVTAIRREFVTEGLTAVYGGGEPIRVELGNLDKNHLRDLIAQCVYRSPDEVEDLALLIHRKTRGNPLAIKEFISEIHRTKLLYFDRKHREWAWDIDGITQSPPTNNVGEGLAHHISSLDQQTMEALKIASCVGDEFELDTIKRVSGLTFSETSSCLIRAVTEGFLLYSEGGRSSYRFAHEQIQQAAYQMLDGIERGQIHAQIGRTYLSEGDPDSRIFEVVNQLNNSIDEANISNDGRVELAELNLHAGRKAKNQAAFQASFRYLRMAIAVQGRNVWDNYELSMDAHLEAAEAAYFCGDQEQLNTLTTAILGQAKTTLEKTRAYEIQLKALITSNKLDLAIDIGHQVLELLNKKIPRVVSLPHLIYWSSKILLTARFRSNQKKIMTNPEELASMRILRVLCQAGYLSGRSETAAYIFKMTELSLQRGLAPESSFAYPLFGAIIIRYFGTITLGHQFGTLALKNLDDSNQDMYCITHAVVHSFVSFWKQNLRATLDPLATAEKIGFEKGDIEFAQIAGTAACLNGLIAGQDLNTLDTSLNATNATAREFNQRPMLDLGLIFQQTVRNLLQNTESPWLLEDSLYSEQSKTPAHRSERDFTTLTNLYVIKTVLATVFRQHELSYEYAVTARRSLDTLISSPLIPFFTVFETLAYIRRLAREKPINAIKLKLRIKKNIRSLRKWAQHAPMNTTPGYELVLAEQARVDQMDSVAISHYEAAMNAAERYNQNHMLAVGQELAGRFYESKSSDSLATYYLLRARNSYVRWGATTKVKQLDSEYRDLADQSSRYFRRNQTVRDTTEQTYSDYLDLGSVIKASQALSGEIILDTLLEKLMQVALENAGAQAAGLVLTEGDDLWVEILSRYNGATTDHRLQRQRLSDSQSVPSSVLQYVARTEEDLVLNDASSTDMFTQDAYISRVKPRSILCVPILSKSHLTGVLYLENRQSTSAFSEDRVAVLRLLASQSAIAIENAKLYQQLNESRDKYLSLYENAVEGIFEIDMNGELISVNPAAAQLMGYPNWINSSKQPVDFAQFFVDPAELKLFTKKLLSDNRILGFETRLNRFDNKEFWVAVSAQVIFEGDRAIKIDGSIIDITERKLRHQAEQATRMAEAATETKSQFLANMSHEIRTPMNAILGYTRLALETDLSSQQHNYLQTIKNSSDHLLRVVNDILDISKIESGKLELQSNDFDLNDVLDDIRRLFKLTADKKNLEFVVPNVPRGWYRGDAVRLGQVLINLVSNAIKFTDQGKVIVSLNVLPLHDDTHCLNFVVSDTGCGIPESATESIFDSFSQVSQPHAEGGTGLGLAISRNIVEKMQGQISVTSVLGIGSQFHFSVVMHPLVSEAFTTHGPSKQPSAYQSNTILLVEDNPINRDLAREVLLNNGYQVVEAENGKDALEQLELQSFDAVLMDLRMPVMNGNEAIKEIRRRDEFRMLPVIALSAGVLQHEIDEAMANGFDQYITKPLDFDKLLTALADLGPVSPAKPVAPIGHPETVQTAELSKQAAGGDVERMSVLGVDFALALHNHDGDAELLHRLLGDFIEFYEDAPTQLKSALEETKLETAERLMHNLAGLAGTFGATELMGICRKSEKSLLDGNVLSEALISDFDLAMGNFIQAIHLYLGENQKLAESG